MISSLQLAKLCGISQGTVDRALHNRPGISAKTKARVLELAARHGYRPNPAVRELLTGQRRTIGAIVPAVNSVFFMDLLNTIAQQLVAQGYRFLLTPIADADAFLKTLEDFAAMRARLVVAVPPQTDIQLPDKLTQSLDIASLINPCQGRRVYNFFPDERQTGRTATDYLLRLGHQKILHLTYQRPSQAIHDRAEGYRQSMAKTHLPARITSPLDPASFLQQIKTDPPTAIFCHNDWLALSAMRLLQAAGFSVPGDISLLGVDDSPTFVSLCPEITTLHYPSESIAHAIGQFLAGAPIPRIAPATLVQRQTVRPYPGH